MVVAPSLEVALTLARGDALRRNADEIAVVGGAGLYAQTLALADRLVVTRVHLRPDGDTKFPAIDPDVWREAERSEHPAGPDDEADFTVLCHMNGAAAQPRYALWVTAHRNSRPMRRRAARARAAL